MLSPCKSFWPTCWRTSATRECSPGTRFQMAVSGSAQITHVQRGPFGILDLFAPWGARSGSYLPQISQTLRRLAQLVQNSGVSIISTLRFLRKNKVLHLLIAYLKSYNATHVCRIRESVTEPLLL